MKNTLYAIAIGLSLLIVLSACASGSGNSAGGGSAADPQSSIPVEELPTVPEEEPPHVEELSPVADAAMYRGVVTAIDEEAGTLTLEQAQGTDFGSPRLLVAVGDITKMNVALSDLTEGAYVQVFYGGTGETVEAITLALLPDADLCLVNGELLESTSEEEGQGSFMMLDRRSGSEILFHYTDETQFYLDFDALEPGEELNVYFSGATTRSLPPQATALEVRPYSEPT